MMILTDQQKAILQAAIGLLNQYDQEKEAYLTVYYETIDENGDTIDESAHPDYDTCNEDDCIKKALADLFAAFPDERINPVYWANDGDHENIGSCYQCGKPLNSQLTWIASEIEHHLHYSITKESLSNSRTAFDVKCCFEAMPTCDYSISQYAKYQDTLGNPKPLIDAKARQAGFVQQVIGYAEKVISILTQS